MPFHESKKIFNRANLNSGNFFAVLSIVFHGNDEESKKQKEAWKRLLKCYIDILHYLTLNREYMKGELDKLEEEACDQFGDLLVRHCGGMRNVTNYFHDIVAGHVVQQTKEWVTFGGSGTKAWRLSMRRCPGLLLKLLCFGEQSLKNNILNQFDFVGVGIVFQRLFSKT
jgi:hypothetical protein